MKTFVLFLIFGVSLAQAQTTTHTKPPLNQSDMTVNNSKKGLLKRAISSFVEKTSDGIKRCSNGAAVKQNDFLGTYNFLSLKVDQLDKQPACENEFIKCLVTDDFSNEISKIIDSKTFIELMVAEKTMTKNEAKQMRKFYRRLISEAKQK